MPGDFSSAKVAADEGSVCPEYERDWLDFIFPRFKYSRSMFAAEARVEDCSFSFLSFLLSD